MNQFETLKNLLLRDRSIRRFKQESVSEETLLDLVSLATLCASGANRQPLVYALVNDPVILNSVFSTLKWAAYYRDWDGPAPNERPVAYIIQALDTDITPNPLCDDGLQLQAITLGATALRLGACIIKSFDASAIKALLNLPDNVVPRYVLALGVPSETSLIVPQRDKTDILYYRDEADRQCVPKRPVDEIVYSINNRLYGR